MKKLLGALTLVTILAGCMSTGVEVKPEQMSDLKPGVTTLHDVLARLGAPTTTATLPDGTTMLVYAFTAAQARPATFIPIVGAFAGGSDVRSSVVSLQFSPDGVLRSKSGSTSQSGSQQGTTTTSAPMSTDQPRKTE